MTAEEIKYEKTWISKNETMECEILSIYRSKIGDKDMGILLKNIRGMEDYIVTAEGIPLSLNMFLKIFEPKI